MQKHARLVGMLCVFGALAAAGEVQAQKLPSFVRLSLAGASLVNPKSFVTLELYDPKEEYYLIARKDCDGDALELILTPDPEKWGQGTVDNVGDESLKPADLPNLRTGKGVNIGETPSVVKRKLGRAPHYQAYNAKTKTRSYVYFTKVRAKFAGAKSVESRLYQAKYIFRGERLREIVYSADLTDSC